MRKAVGVQAAWDLVKQLSRLVAVANTGRGEIDQALISPFADLEDRIQQASSFIHTAAG